MDIQELATAQDGLAAELETTLREFKEAHPEVTISGLFVDTWSESAPKVTSNMTATIEGARVSRATEQQAAMP